MDYNSILRILERYPIAYVEKIHKNKDYLMLQYLVSKTLTPVSKNHTLIHVVKFYNYFIINNIKVWHAI